MERKGNINMWNIFVGKGERRWEVKGVIPLSLLLCEDCFLGVKWCCVDFLKGMPGFYMNFFLSTLLAIFLSCHFREGMCKYFGMLWGEFWRKVVWVFTQEDEFWLAKPVLLFLWCLPLHIVCPAILADFATLGSYWFTLLTLLTYVPYGRSVNAIDSALSIHSNLSLPDTTWRNKALRSLWKWSHAAFPYICTICSGALPFRV